MIITLSGSFGSGGEDIAKILAEKLGYRLFGKEIVRRAAEISGSDLKASTEKFYDEDMDRLDTEKGYSKALMRMQFDTLPEKMTSNWNIVAHAHERTKQINANRKAVLEAIEEVQHGNCIFLGRCAGYFLKDNPETVRIYTLDSYTDNIKARIRRDFPNISDAEILKLAKLTDKRREEYYEYLTQQQLYDMKNFDYVFNVGYLGVDTTADLIIKIIAEKEKELRELELITEK